MIFDYRDERKRLYVWVDHKSSDTFDSSSKYHEALAKAKAMQYSVCVFVGGQAPIENTIANILEHQDGMAA